MNKFIYIFSFAIILGSSGCLNIAPHEEWDNDDTRIWIEHASSLDLTVHWFKEQKSNRDTTILDYRDEFEIEILNQITESPYFNESTSLRPESDLYSKVSHNQLKGIWCEVKNGYKFLQLKGNQYPMTIYIDTIGNEVIIKSNK